MSDKPIEFLSQPFLTEDGFVNPACMAELEAAIEAMPPTYERLSGDPEWTTPGWVFLREIAGHLACWAVRQGARPAPNIEKAVDYLIRSLRGRFDGNEMAELSLCDVNRMLHEVMFDLPEFAAWNTVECLGADWLDLHALLHNVSLSIRQERRANADFDRRFSEVEITPPA